MMNKNFIMTNGTIKSIEVFADTVKTAMEFYYGDNAKVMIHEVNKNNGIVLKALTIAKSDCNISPTIYLEPYYREYKAGISMESICKEIMLVYEKHSVNCNFDITFITNFDKVKDKICFKLINAEKNKSLLNNVPHKIFLDLAVVYYIEVFQDNAGNGTILVQNQLLKIWKCVDNDLLYRLALDNTQRKHRGRITSMSTIITEMFEAEYTDQFFDLTLDEDVPMYVASNVQKMLGAGVVLYDGLLRIFAENIDNNFYILPSSTHEVLFVPDFMGIEVEYLKQMVQEVNSTEVSEQEFLSDNVYYYSIEDDRMVIV